MSKNVTYIFIFIIFVLVTIVGYFVYQNQKLIGKLTSRTITTPTSSPSSQPSLTPNSSPSPKLTKAQIEENIKAAVNSKNFAALENYMTTTKVNFSLMSTECCEPMTPDEAVDQMSYIKDGIPMDFDPGNQTIVNLKSKNPQLAETFIGLSKNDEQLAAFTLDAQNKISAIQLSVSWKLYSY